MSTYAVTTNEYLSRLTNVLQALDHEQIDKAVDFIDVAWKAGGADYYFG